MRWIISLLLFLSINCFAQEIKHIELISEIQDSMALINKSDIDSVNKMFHEHRILDSLNIVNENIISILNEEQVIADSIIVEQRSIIDNDVLILEQEQQKHAEEVEYYKDEMKKQSNRKVLFQSTTGLGILVIILIILL